MTSGDYGSIVVFLKEFAYACHVNDDALRHCENGRTFIGLSLGAVLVALGFALLKLRSTLKEQPQAQVSAALSAQQQGAEAMGKKNAGEKDKQGHSQPFPKACVDAAAKYWVNDLDASHQYAFKGSNGKLFSQMNSATYPDVQARANQVFGQTPPTLDAPGQTTTGEPIYWVNEPAYTCP
jgi:hypothetical protein